MKTIEIKPLSSEYVRSERELYSFYSLCLAALLGTSLGATYLMKRNYEQMGMPEEGKKILNTGILIWLVKTLLGATIIYFWENEITGWVFYVAEVIVCGYLAVRLQKEVLEHCTVFYSMWTAFKISLAASLFAYGIAITLGLLLIGIDGVIDSF